MADVKVHSIWFTKLPLVVPKASIPSSGCVLLHRTAYDVPAEFCADMPDIVKRSNFDFSLNDSAQSKFHSP